MSVSATTIYVAIELSNTVWLVGTRLPGAAKATMQSSSLSDWGFPKLAGTA